MSNYYDPWAHAVHLFFTRVLQFVGLSALLTMAIWAALLSWHFPDSNWTALARWSWDLAHQENRHWKAVFVLCMAIACSLVGWLFTTISLLSRLRGGDRHHRGSRVVQHAQD